jgi:hypothetical protein
MRKIELVDDKGKVKIITILNAESIAIDEEQDIYMIRVTLQCQNCSHKYTIDVEDADLMTELVNMLNSTNEALNPEELPIDITCPNCTIKMFLN